MTSTDLTTGPNQGPASRANGGQEKAHRGTRSALRRPGWVATLFVLPYLLLSLAWLGSNPPGAAPDEYSHLIKGLAIARLDIGVPFTGTLKSPGPLQVRNASITRMVDIPARLWPAGYMCFAFKSDVTADCQPAPRDVAGDVRTGTEVGAYPPFAYLPIGLATRAATTPAEAFTLGRIVVLIESMALFWLAVWHLVRWLGPRALLGVVVAVTPMAVFCAGILNTSGLEIFGALGVASVVAVYLRRPESLAKRRTLAVLVAAGSGLVLSRQLGIITMGALVLLLLGAGAWRPVWEQIRRRSLPMIATVSLLGIETVAVIIWELRYDHPALLGPWVSRTSVHGLADTWLNIAYEGVGRFGWLDVLMPTWITASWLVAAAALVLWGLARGGWRDRLIIVGMFLGLGLLATVTYSRVFFGVGATMQGRHMLPFAVFLPVFAGIIVTDRINRRTFARLMVPLALVASAAQFYALYLNGKRYAVGLNSALTWFVPDAKWSPPFGWLPWLTLGLLACVAMVAVWVQLGRGDVGAGDDDEDVSSTSAMAST